MELLAPPPPAGTTTTPTETMATEQLEAELVSYAAWETVGLARHLQVLAEFDRREGWATWGCRSAQQWLSWKCGLGYTAATERLRVAHALDDLPEIAARFAAGRLSWSKVRELTRVATADTEDRWCDVAEHSTAAQLATLTRAARRITAEQATRQLVRRGLSWTTDDDGGVTITVSLPADQAMTVLAAVQAATTPQAGAPWRQSAADALVDLVTGDRSVTAQVVVHHSPDGAYVEDGPAIAAGVADALACDHPVTTVIDRPDGPVVIERRRAPSKRQRQVLAHHHPTCQFPGCHHTGRFEAHHVVEHAKGGRTTLSNLVRLCGFHHRLVHLWHLVLTLHPDRTLAVARADGSPVDRHVPTGAPAHCPPPSPDAIGGRWAGEPLDVDLCLSALVSPRQVSDFSAEKITPPAGPPARAGSAR